MFDRTIKEWPEQERERTKLQPHLNKFVDLKKKHDSQISNIVVSGENDDDGAADFQSMPAAHELNDSNWMWPWQWNRFQYEKKNHNTPSSFGKHLTPLRAIDRIENHVRIVTSRQSSERCENEANKPFRQTRSLYY